jgi:hypothetical protein
VSASAKIRRAPVRLAMGAFILWSGVGHLNPDEQTVAEVHGMAAVAYPFLMRRSVGRGWRAWIHVPTVGPQELRP